MAAPWDLGNILAQSSGVPVRWSETVSPELASLFYSDQPDAVYQQLAAKSLRYIVLPARNLAEKFLGEMFAADLKVGDMYENVQRAEWHRKTMSVLTPNARNRATFIVRLYWDRGQEMSHFRMVYETPSQAIHATRLDFERSNIDFYSFAITQDSRRTFEPLLKNPARPMETSRGVLINSRLAPSVRIFEAVPGAVLECMARPKSQAVAIIELKSPTTRTKFAISLRTTADQDGHVALRLPYPTDQPMSPAPGTVQVQGPYQVVIDGKTSRLEVSEKQIQDGAHLSLSR
jgi:hypothetical protein